MLQLTKAVIVLLSSFITSLIIGFILIPYLKQLKVKQHLSKYLKNTHQNKMGTPTMGGLIFIFSSLIITALLIYTKKININYSLILVVFTFVSYAIIGFIDDYIIVIKKNNKGLSETQKLLFQTIISIVFFYIYLKANNEPLLWIHTINFKQNIGYFYGIVILLVLLSSSNAVNITDGLDGLATGLSIISYLTFGIIAYNTRWLDGYESIALFCFSVTGSLLGFLTYNANPAKIFMGDTGSLALGATLGAIAIVTRHELLLVLVGIVFVIETTSCIIQRIYYKITQKRIFLMTPIHHTFEKLGWEETEIVKLFWIIGLIASLIAISFGVLL